MHQSRALLIAKKTKSVIKSCLVGYTTVLFLIKINLNSCSLCVVITVHTNRLPSGFLQLNRSPNRQIVNFNAIISCLIIQLIPFPSPSVFRLLVVIIHALSFYYHYNSRRVVVLLVLLPELRFVFLMYCLGILLKL